MENYYYKWNHSQNNKKQYKVETTNHAVSGHVISTGKTKDWHVTTLFLFFMFPLLLVLLWISNRNNSTASENMGITAIAKTCATNLIEGICQ